MHKQRSIVGGAIALVAALSIGGCGTAPIMGASGPPVEAPQLRVGDRWVYRAVDGYRQRERLERDARDHVHRRQRHHRQGGHQWRRDGLHAHRGLDGAGVVRIGAIHDIETDRFDPALIRYQYPMTNGASWSQQMRNLDKPPNPFGEIRSRATVSGYESVSTPAGTFNAIKIRYLIQLDDATLWRNATQCDYVVWYAPDVGAMVREQKRSYYLPEDIEAGAEDARTECGLRTDVVHARPLIPRSARAARASRPGRGASRASPARDAGGRAPARRRTSRARRRRRAAPSTPCRCWRRRRRSRSRGRRAGRAGPTTSRRTPASNTPCTSGAHSTSTSSPGSTRCLLAA